MDHGRPLIKINEKTYRGTANISGVLWKRIGHLERGGGADALMGGGDIAHERSMEE
jgi:hypothetical protein